MQAPMNRAMHPQAPADVQHALPIFVTQPGHALPVQVTPAPDEPPEEELFGAAQLPTLHTWLTVVQLLHTWPPVPQAALSEPPWHMLFESQHPAQLAPEHPTPLPLLDPPAQLPLWQIPVTHVVPHPPQLFGFVCSLTHTPLQSV
jgi:hypothetical protein